ncbi:MAG: glycosyltransferase [Bacteroidales bacterium]
MKIALFYHSLYSDWNHGNAHFLRGIMHELQKKGHSVNMYEPANGWSMHNLLKHYGREPLEEFHHYFPHLFSRIYDLATLDLEEELKGIDLVIVHEWTDQALIKAIGEKKSQLGFLLLYHDTHHRVVTDAASLAQTDFSLYDGVLAFGDVIREIYLQKGLFTKGWTWHEAADTNIFKPIEYDKKTADIVWIGNWGDDERTGELHEFLIQPVKELGLKAKAYGVRYPLKAIEALTEAGIEYGGWIPNYKVPEVFSRYRLTLHIPRRPYVEKLPGVSTIRPYEAMACGIPLICSPWHDTERLFTEGKDFLMAQDGDQMKQLITRILNDDTLARDLTAHALNTIASKHTCRHRVEQLENICQEMGLNPKVMSLQQT